MLALVRGIPTRLVDHTIAALPGGRARSTPRQCHQTPILAPFYAGIKYGYFADEGQGGYLSHP